MRCAVLGKPIAHSLSPVLHRAAYADLGLDWTYEARRGGPRRLAQFLDGLDESWRGLSLTMPLKRTVVPLVDSLDDWARLSGVANTVVLGGGRDLASTPTSPGRWPRWSSGCDPFAPRGGARRGGHGDLGAARTRRAGLHDGPAARARPGPGRGDRHCVAAHPARARLSVVRVEETRRVSGRHGGLDRPAAAQTPELLAACAAAPAVFEVIYDPWPTPLARAALGLRARPGERSRPARPPGRPAGRADDRAVGAGRAVAGGGRRGAGAPGCGERRRRQLSRLAFAPWTGRPTPPRPRGLLVCGAGLVRARLIPRLRIRQPRPEPEPGRAEPARPEARATRARHRASTSSCSPSPAASAAQGALRRHRRRCRDLALGSPLAAAWSGHVGARRSGGPARSLPGVARAGRRRADVIDWRTTLLPTRIIHPTYVVLAVLIPLAALVDRDLVRSTGRLGLAGRRGWFWLFWFLPQRLGLRRRAALRVLGPALGYLGWSEMPWGWA